MCSWQIQTQVVVAPRGRLAPVQRSHRLLRPLDRRWAVSAGADTDCPDRARPRGGRIPRPRRRLSRPPLVAGSDRSDVRAGEPMVGGAKLDREAADRVGTGLNI
jgi:hypothetical protein